MFDVHLMSFGKLLKFYRLKMGKSQDGMAILLKVPCSTYKSWEYEKNLPTQQRLKSISKTLDKLYPEERPLPSEDLNERYIKIKLRGKKNG